MCSKLSASRQRDPTQVGEHRRLVATASPVGYRGSLCRALVHRVTM